MGRLGIIGQDNNSSTENSGSSRLGRIGLNEQELEAESKKRTEEDKRLQEERAAEEARKKGDETKNHALNFIAKLSRPISEGGANPLADVGRFIEKDIVKAGVDSAVNFVKQAQMGAEGATDYRFEQLSKARDRFADEDFASGAISAERRDAIKAENQAKLDQAKQKTAEIEAKSGRKYDQDQGAVDAIETLSMIDLPYALIKGGVKTGSSLMSKFGKGSAEEGIDAVEASAKVLDSSKDTEALIPDIETGQFKGTFLDPRKIEVTGKSNGVEEVGVSTPIRPGIRQESATYNVGVRTPKPLSDDAYTKRLNSLSKAYDKELKLLENKGPLAQSAATETIDAKYAQLMDELDIDYKNGVLPKKTLISKISSKVDKAEKTTGGAPKSGVNVPITDTPTPKRADKYIPDTKKSRVTKDEAVSKLQSAGYTTDESVAILSDALPDKGLSMPGSPKKLGYSEESIIKAADDLDASQAPAIEAPPVTTLPATAEGTGLTSLASIDGTAEKGTSKLASSVQSKAIDEKLISKTEAEVAGLPEYNKANMKQQAEYATGLIKSDPQTAIDIAMGRKAPPQHVLPQMVYNAVEDHAMKIGGEKGGKLLKELANSKQVSDLTVMAQNVRAAAERDPHSPVALINELKLARAEAAKKRGKDTAKTEKVDMKAIEKATPKVTKDDWDTFVKELEC